MQQSTQERLYNTTPVEAMAPEIPPMSTAGLDIDEMRLVRRIDLRVMPILSLIYVAAFLDRYSL